MSGDGEGEVLDRVHDLTGSEFEEFVAALWELQGWTTEVTDARSDDGRDVVAERNLPFEVKLKIEAKGWTETNVPAPKIRQYALLPGDDADHAVVVTSSSFTEPAREAAARNDVKLVDRAVLLRLIQKLDAEPLLGDELETSDWEEVTAEKHLDWVAERLGDAEPVTVIEGIGDKRAEQLAEAGIHTANDLLLADPAEVDTRTGLAETQVKRWANLAAYHLGPPTDDIDDIDQGDAEELAEADVYTVDDLQDACPRAVASQTEFTERTLKGWVGDAVHHDGDPVTQIEGIGPEYARKLAKAGIFTVADLAAADPRAVARRAGLREQFTGKLIQKARNFRG